METREVPAACLFCEEAFTLPEEDNDANIPRVLLCGHIFCTSCLWLMEQSNTISCPDCEVVSVLPEGGVYGLQEESRIIGLIYTGKMNKMKKSNGNRKNTNYPPGDMNGNTLEMDQPADIERIERTVDEALATAAENLAQLEHMHEVLRTGLAQQVNKDRARLETEIRHVADKATNAIQKWTDVQLKELTKMQPPATSQADVVCVQERIKTLEIAMQIAREVRRIPFLEQYCTLDKVLKTLLAPVDNQSMNIKGSTVGSGLSCVLQSEIQAQSLGLCLKMKGSYPENLSEVPSSQLASCHKPSSQQAGSRKNTHSCGKFARTQKKHKQRSGAIRVSSQGLYPSPRLGLLSSHSASDVSSSPPAIVIEELITSDGELHAALPPTRPELTDGKCGSQRRGKQHLPDIKRNVSQFVVVTHIVNPSHFYVCYMAKKRERETLLKRINHYCCSDSCHFTSRDTVETGSMVFMKCDEGLWWRASVVEVFRKGCSVSVKACPVSQLTSIRGFLPDSGVTKMITIQRKDEAASSSLEAVNNQLRKLSEAMTMELDRFGPQAVRCSFKDIVPYDLIKGWSIEAQVEFSNVVGTEAVEMHPLGQDKDSMLVDLRKSPMNQSSDVPISIREYLVFIEVARFYSPVKLSGKTLLYYPPVYPKINTQLNAVVTHIISPSDFHIQLVDNMESLLLFSKLQECYNAMTGSAEDDLHLYCPVSGQACVARYEENLWYRAQVIGHPGGQKVEVRYVDFGNKKIVSVSDLRKIKDEFFALPSLAIYCCLSDMIPLDGQTWSDACINRFTSLAHQKLVTIMATGNVPKSEPLSVKLFERSLSGPGANIAELLVAEELARFRLKSSASVPTSDTTIWDPPLEVAPATTGSDQNQAKEPFDFQPQLQFPKNLKDLKVRVTHVNSPSSFYVQFAQNDPQLKRMCELLKRDLRAPPKPEDVMWKADMLCAAYNNGVWERGQICSDVTCKIAEVMRCDYGNKLELPVSKLRRLPSSLIGAFALECTLIDIRPAGGQTTWTATACDILSYYLSGASAVMTIKELTAERPVPVTLMCTNKKGQPVSVSDFLVGEGLALRERKPMLAQTDVQGPNQTDAQCSASTPQEDTSAIRDTPPAPPPIPLPLLTSSVTASRPVPAHRTIMSAEKVKTQLYQPPELPCLGHIKMTISAVGDDGLIYARTQNAECQLEQLKERIKQSIKTLPRQKLYTWKSVLGCAIMGHDMSWYRGQLCEVLGGHVVVQHVDYGLVENIPVVHVYPMLLCDDVPQLCLPCQLHGLNPFGGSWQQDAVALLKELLLSRCVDVHVLELPSDPRKPLSVEIFLDGLSLSRIMCHHKHATTAFSAQEEPSVTPRVELSDGWDIDTKMGPEELVLGPFLSPNLPQLGRFFRAKVTHLVTPNELFLSVNVNAAGEALNKALARINAKTENLQQLTSFPEGSPCMAEYSDGRFYRAKLIKLVSVEPVTALVHHVDFGSDDSLPTSKLRQMPAELLQFPIQVFKVHVTGFKAPSTNRQERVLPYSPEWSMEAVMEMIDLLHSNIMAYVVSLEPELTVLLYDEEGNLVHLALVNSGLAELE